MGDSTEPCHTPKLTLKMSDGPLDTGITVCEPIFKQLQQFVRNVTFHELNK